MDYLSASAISESGVDIEALRMKIVAANLANVNSTDGTLDGVYRPQRLISTEASAMHFDSHMARSAGPMPGGAAVGEIAEVGVEPRLEHRPGHPNADENGFIATPNVNSAHEMMTMLSAMRSYEANVRAFNATKQMALQALQIGAGS